MRLPRVFVFALLLLGVVGTFWFYVASNACMTDTSSIPAPGGGAFAEIVETSCDVLGGSNVVEIAIVSSGSRLRSSRFTVFKYDPSSFSGPVNVTWVSEKELAISIDGVEGFETKETRVAGYTIGYHIGAVGPLVERKAPREQR
jgi:hypothetical protein